MVSGKFLVVSQKRQRQNRDAFLFAEKQPAFRQEACNQ